MLILDGDSYMIIVHVGEYVNGGVATYLKNIIEFQAKEEKVRRIYLIMSNYNSETISFESPKIKIIKFKYIRRVSNVLKLLKLRKIIDKLNPDIVHFHSTFAGLIRLTYFLRSAHYSVFYCAHGWSFLRDDMAIKTYTYGLVERLLAKKTDRIINVSKYEQRAAIDVGIPVDKMKVIYNSLKINKPKYDVNINSPFIRKSSVKLIFVGRLDQQKGLDFVLSNYSFNDGKMELAVIGDNVVDHGFDYSPYHSNKNIHFLGWIDNDKIDTYINYSDALIMPSRWEAFGLTALEAMRTCKAVIASDAGALPEIVKNNQNGLLFKNGCATSLRDILSQIDRRKLVEMGKNGFNRLNTKFNPNRINQQLLNEYLSVSLSSGQKKLGG